MEPVKRRPHLEREELLQAFILGAMAANTKLVDKLGQDDFAFPWSAGYSTLKDTLADVAGAKEALDRWLSATIGVDRNGRKAVDAAIEQLKADGVFRRAEKGDPFAARLARLIVAMQERGKVKR